MDWLIESFIHSFVKSNRDLDMRVTMTGLRWPVLRAPTTRQHITSCSTWRRWTPSRPGHWRWTQSSTPRCFSVVTRQWRAHGPVSCVSGVFAAADRRGDWLPATKQQWPAWCCPRTAAYWSLRRLTARWNCGTSRPNNSYEHCVDTPTRCVQLYKRIVWLEMFRNRFGFCFWT